MQRVVPSTKAAPRPAVTRLVRGLPTQNNRRRDSGLRQKNTLLCRPAPRQPNPGPAPARKQVGVQPAPQPCRGGLSPCPRPRPEPGVAWRLTDASSPLIMHVPRLFDQLLYSQLKEAPFPFFRHKVVVWIFWFCFCYIQLKLPTITFCFEIFLFLSL